MFPMAVSKMSLQDTKNIAEITAFLAAAIWFTVNAAFRGQMDAVVEL